MFLFFYPAFFRVVLLLANSAETRCGSDKKMSDKEMKGGKIEKSLLPYCPFRHLPIVTDLP